MEGLGVRRPRGGDMLKLRRVSIVTGLVVVGGIYAAVPALADDGYGSTTCNQMPAPVCDLGAGRGGDNSKPENPGDGNRPGRPGSGNPGNGNSNPGDTIIGGNSNLANCSYVKSDRPTQTPAARPRSPLCSPFQQRVVWFWRKPPSQHRGSKVLGMYGNARLRASPTGCTGRRCGFPMDGRPERLCCPRRPSWRRWRASSCGWPHR